jgi:hypothetical protein
MNDATELTIRDVLQQMDRRLTIVEEGLKALAAELKSEVAALRSELAGLRGEMASLRSEMTSGFRWIVGLMVAGWLSMVGLLLPILLRS